MPSLSRKQQRFFGMVRATQKGEMENPSPEVAKVAATTKRADVKKFASTKHDKLPEKNLNDDGYLTALEISKLNWNGTELVVVSGCESGQGDLRSGEGVYGLKRAITVAGAKSSLLSLWEVDDKATAAFMESFYLKLKSGESRSNALSKTQKEFRKHNTGAWQHPNVWAAFQLNGDWRAIKW